MYIKYNSREIFALFSFVLMLLSRYLLYLENSTKMYFVLNEVKILRFIIFPWCETQLEQKTTCVEDNTLYHNADPDPALYFNEDSDSDTGPRLHAWTSKLQEVKNQ